MYKYGFVRFIAPTPAEFMHASRSMVVPVAAGLMLLTWGAGCVAPSTAGTRGAGGPRAPRYVPEGLDRMEQRLRDRDGNYHRATHGGSDAMSEEDDYVCFAPSADTARAVLARVAGCVEVHRRGLFPKGLPDGLVIVVTAPEHHTAIIESARYIALGVSTDTPRSAVALADYATLGSYHPSSRTLFTRNSLDTLAHEVVHALHHADYGYSYIGPLWFAEGLARVCTTHRAPDIAIAPFPYEELERVIPRIESGELPTLAQLFATDHTTFSPSDYDHAALVVQWLREQGEVERYLNAIKNLPSDERDSVAALSRALDLDASDLDKRWRAWLRMHVSSRPLSPITTADPRESNAEQGADSNPLLCGLVVLALGSPVLLAGVAFVRRRPATQPMRNQMQVVRHETAA